MRTLTLADELVLIAYGDKSGRSAGMYLDHGVAAAILVELAFAGRIAMKDGLIVRKDATPTGDRGLDETLEHLAQCDVDTPGEWLATTAGFVNYQRIRNQLVDEGVLERRPVRVLGVVVAQRYLPGEDDTREADALQRVRAAIDRGFAEDVRTAMLGRLLGAMQLEARVLRKHGLTARFGLRAALTDMSYRQHRDSAVKGKVAATSIIKELAFQVGIASSSAKTAGPTGAPR